MSLCYIRLALPDDQPGAYCVCLKTGDFGRDGEPYYREDPDALGRLFVGPYLAYEPGLSFILEDDEGICGYALGAFDSRAFYARYEAEWRPRLCAQFPAPSGDPSQWTRVQEVYDWYHHPDYFCPDPYDSYPSHLHIDLLPRAQGRGYGRRMLAAVMEEMVRRGSPGAHLGVSTRNSAALGFYQRLGFEELTRAGTGNASCIYMGKRFEGNAAGGESVSSGTPALAALTALTPALSHPMGEGEAGGRAGPSRNLALFGGKPVRTRPFTSWPIFDRAEEERLLRALHSGKWGRLDGSQLAEFERRFAEMHGCKHGIAVVNGTVSLRIALLAAGIKAEEEVIVPPYTFFSTASAVIEANAIPVFADIDLDTFNLDPGAVEAAITPRTRAIIPVHFAGQPADMEVIMAIARKRGLVVIEDAAHAHGAIQGNRAAGSIGDLGSFSFQSSKNMTAGEGGLITTNSDTLAEACRSVHNCGRVQGGVWDEHHTISGNYRLGEFQGAVLNAQLDRLEEQTKTRDRNGRLLASRLAALPGLHPQQRPASCQRHSYHLFMLRLDAARFGAPRQAVLRALKAEGIPCSAGYAFSLPHQPMFRNKSFGPYLAGAAAGLDYGKVSCPNSDLICREQGVWIEQSVLLGPESDMDDIARAFEKVYENRSELSQGFGQPENQFCPSREAR